MNEALLFQAIQSLSEFIVDGVLLLAPNGDLVMANRTTLEFFEAKSIESIRKLEERASRFVILDGERRPVPSPNLPANRVTSGERLHDLEQIYVRRRNGREYTLRFSGAPVYGEDGEIAFAFVILTDITAHARRGRAFEERYRVLLDQMAEMVMTRTLGGTVTHVNRSLTEFVGRPADQLIGKHVEQVFSVPADESHVADEVTGRLRTGARRVTKRMRLLDRTGAVHDIDFDWRLIARPDDEPEVLAVARDVTAYAERERLLSAENELMTSLVRVIRRIFTGLDPRALVDSVVRGARELLGGTATLYAALADGTFAAVDDVEWPPRPGAQVQDAELAHTAADGEVHFDASYRRMLLPIASSDGPTRWVLEVRLQERSGIPFDVALFAAELLARNFAVAVRNVALYGELEEQRASVIELNQSKSDLIAMLAHDFKGPLTTIAGYGQLLLDGEIDDEEERQAALRRMVDAAMRLANLAGDTLALSRLEENEPVLHIARFDVVGILREVVQAQSSQREVRLTSELPSAAVDGDAERLRQVFENLISNAVKYSPDGSSVEVLVRRDGNEAVIDVRDRGIGIPADELESVFARFARASNARRLGITGSGFGLYLAKQFVEKMGGSITAFSIERSGSTFSVHLPLAESSAAAGAAEPKRVLVADDDDDARTFMAHALRGAGYAVRAAADGTEALERLRVERFDAAVLDMEMPGLSGEEVRTRFLERHPRASIGFVLTSGLPRPVPAGWNGFVAKPFLVKDFVAAVGRALTAAPSADRAASDQAPGEARTRAPSA